MSYSILVSTGAQKWGDRLRGKTWVGDEEKQKDLVRGDGTIE